MTLRLHDYRPFFWAMLVAALYPVFFAYGWELKYYPAVVSLLFAIDFLLAFIVACISGRRTRRTLSVVFLLLTFVNGLTKLIGITLVHGEINKDVIAAIFATNANEASEMMGMLLTVQSVCIFLGYPLILTLCIYVCRKRRKRLPPVFNRYGIVVFVLSVCVVAAYCAGHGKKRAIENETPGYLVQLAIAAHDAVQSNVKICRTDPRLDVCGEGQPPLIIFVFGESTARCHSSLYGYEKPTNPLLRKKCDEGQVFRFTNVTSAWTHTLESFKFMMSTYSKSSPATVKWNECDNMLDIAHNAGYHTSWFSNQSKKGIWDNLVGQYSDLCDTAVFVGNKYAGSLRSTLDGDLIPIVKEALAKPSNDKELYIVHLMGCHVEFRCRYPDNFARFKESDYTNYPASQRSVLAAYDNAMLYNDYVVNSIFDLARDREAVVVYAPDHGLDLYKSRPDYCDHGIDGDTISMRAAREIPFVIYLSPLYRQRHPDMVERMAKSVGNDFDTEDVVYLAMDLMQCDFITPVVKRNSLIR